MHNPSETMEGSDENHKRPQQLFTSSNDKFSTDGHKLNSKNAKKQCIRTNSEPVEAVHSSKQILKRKATRWFRANKNKSKTQLKNASRLSFYSEIKRDKNTYLPKKARSKFPLKDNVDEITKLLTEHDQPWCRTHEYYTFVKKWKLYNGKIVSSHVTDKFQEPRCVTCYEDIFDTIYNVDKKYNFNQSLSALSTEVSKSSYNISMKLVKLYTAVCQLRKNNQRVSSSHKSTKKVDRRTVMMKGKQFVKKLNGLTAVSIFEESSESENESHDDFKFTTTNAQPKQGKVLVEDKCVQTSNENVISKHDRNTLVIDLDKESNVKVSSDATKVNVNGEILIDVDNKT